MTSQRLGRHLKCTCGEKVLACDGQAGEDIVCPQCGASVSVPALTALRQLPLYLVPESASGAKPWKLQFRLRHLLQCTAFFAVLAAIAHYTGVIAFLLAVGAFAVIWPTLVVLAIVLAIAARSFLQFVRWWSEDPRP